MSNAPGLPEKTPEDIVRNIFKTAIQLNGSDIHIKPGSPPKIRISGELRPLKLGPLSPDTSAAWVQVTMDSDTKSKFHANGEADYAYSIDGVGRFRVNAYRTRGSMGMVARVVNSTPTQLVELGIPKVVEDLAMKENGLCLVTGATGSGKSSTLAGMVDYINRNKSVHIVTIEDPIETVHSDIRSSISQREVFSDTQSFDGALRAAMRQDPDVILIGEMRDVDTVRAALAAAETGHFVLSTLHTTDAAETVNRIIDFFPSHEQNQIKIALSTSLRGVICQRLVKKENSNQRLPVVEIMINEGRVSEAILNGDTTKLPEIINEDSYYGMQTFDSHLISLVQDGEISVATAMKVTRKPDDLSLVLRNMGIRVG